MVKIRKKFLRPQKQKISEEKAGVLLSINSKNKEGKQWLDELLIKKENTYSSWSIKSAFEGQKIWIAESGIGVSCFAKVGFVDHESDSIKVKFVEAEKIDVPITVDELRDLEIITKNTPRTFMYLSSELCEKLEDLFK